MANSSFVFAMKVVKPNFNTYCLKYVMYWWLLLFVCRDARKYFPLDASEEEENEDNGGGGDGDDVVEPGCCSLCERVMPLTRHHVMPKWVVLLITFILVSLSCSRSLAPEC